jgi:hypothetical protein
MTLYFSNVKLKMGTCSRKVIMSGLCKMKMSGFLKDEKRPFLAYKGFRGGPNEPGADSDEPDGNGAIADSSSGF